MEDYIKAVLNGEDYFGSVSFVDDTDRETALRVLEDLGTNTDMETVDDLNDTVIFDRNAFDKDACAAKIAVVCNGLISPDDVLDYIREEALMDDERVYAVADAENIEKCNTLVNLARYTNWGKYICDDADLANLFQAVDNNSEYTGGKPLYELVSEQLTYTFQRFLDKYADKTYYGAVTYGPQAIRDRNKHEMILDMMNEIEERNFTSIFQLDDVAIVDESKFCCTQEARDQFDSDMGKYANSCIPKNEDVLDAVVKQAIKEGMNPSWVTNGPSFFDEKAIKQYALFRHYTNRELKEGDVAFEIIEHLCENNVTCVDIDRLDNSLSTLANETHWGEDIPGTDLAKLFQAVKNEEEYAGETPLNDLLNDPDVCQCRYGVSPQEYAAKLIGECREAKQHDKALANLKAVAANIEIAQQQQDSISL